MTSIPVLQASVISSPVLRANVLRSSVVVLSSSQVKDVCQFIDTLGFPNCCFILLVNSNLVFVVLSLCGFCDIFVSGLLVLLSASKGKSHTLANRQ